MPDRKRTVGAAEQLETEPARGRLELLGVPTLHIQSRQLRPIERKTAGMLAYLTLEGPTTRSKLAGLLWPESSESTARNNLAQALRRLRQGVGVELVVGSDALMLQNLPSDLAQLEVAHFAGRHQELAEASGVLLEGCDYDDCPDFDDWLLVQREKLAELRRMSLAALADEFEQAGQYREAIIQAERLLEADALSESAHRRVMRLWYLLGDRSAALAAFERCAAVLKREMGVQPLPETLGLLRLIERGEQVTPNGPLPRVEIPLSVLRPPRLFGREAEWAQMERAWTQGQALLVAGLPGVGKSRLVQDFLGSKGPFSVFEGRPGDTGIPYATHSRTCRQVLGYFPGLALPEWVQHELARILPELGPAPPPIGSQAEKLRFFQANAELVRLAAAQGMGLVILDDLQFVDAASLELLHFVFSPYWGRVGSVRTILSFRAGELLAGMEELLSQAVQSGLAVRIEVQPLDVAAVRGMLESLELPGLQDSTPELAQAFCRHTGGNPFFLLETLRSLWESGSLSQPKPGHLPTSQQKPVRLPISSKISTLIQQRLERLSLGAQRLIRTAAVAGVDFSPELAAHALETTPLELLEPWAELEAAQLLRGNAFIHDLLYEATLSGVPVSIKTYLHQQIALYLESKQADPARIASHWLEGEPGRAIPFLTQAAKRAEDAYQLVEAAHFYQRAVELAEHQRESEQVFALLEALSEVMSRFDTGSQHAALIQRMLALAHTPEEQGRAWLREAIRLGEHAYGADAEQAARKGLQHIQDVDRPELRIRLLDALAQSLFVQRKATDLIAALQQLRDIHLARGDELQAAICTSRLGIAFDQLERHREALGYYQQAEPVLERSTNRIMRLGFHHNRAVCLAALGYSQAALEAQLQVQRLLEGMQGVVGRELHHLNNLALRYYDLERYAEAQQALERALEIVPEEWGWTRAFSEYQMARLHYIWGNLVEAHSLLERAVAVPDLPIQEDLRYRIFEIWITREQGQPVGQKIEYVEERSKNLGRQAYGQFQMIKAKLSAPEKSIELARETLQMAQEMDFAGLAMYARVIYARGALELGDIKSAVQQMLAVLEVMKQHRSENVTQNEIWFTAYKALKFEDPRKSKEFLERAKSQTLLVATSRVPPDFKKGYLSRPLQQEILQEAQR